MRGILAAAVLAALFAPANASAVPIQVEVYLVYWPSLDGTGGGTANEAELDRFMDCLLAGTNYGELFSTWGGAALTWGGSLGLASPPSDGHFGACDGDVGYVDNLLNHGTLPMPAPGVLPLYVFMVPAGLIASNCYDAGTGSCNSWPDCGQLCMDSVCGLNPGETNYDVSAPWLESWVTTYAACCTGSGRTDLNLETSVIEHEVAETVANAMGGLGTCGDGCEGTASPFIGCPSQVGEPQDWYELQSLSRLRTGSCDFTVEYTGLSCNALGEGCEADAGCCAPLVCGLSDGGTSCCYPSGSRCALTTDCCAGLGCVGGRCSGPADGGEEASDAGTRAGGTAPDAGLGAPSPDAGTRLQPNRGCSTGGEGSATLLTLAALGLFLWRARGAGC